MENKIYWDSSFYDSNHAFVSKYGEQLIELLAPKSDETILDLGCGTGSLASLIATRASSVIGFDSSESMIETARMNFPHIDFRVMDATNFQLDNKVDAIFSNAVLHWVTSVESTVRCMNKNLKTGGRIVLEFGGKGNNQNLISALKKSLKDNGFEKNAEINFWYFPSISSFTSTLENNNFEVQFACLYDRPTELADHVSGVKDWFSMFGEKFFEGMKPKEIKKVLDETQDICIKTNFIDGKWYADYRRIRVVAIKKDELKSTNQGIV